MGMLNVQHVDYSAVSRAVNPPVPLTPATLRAYLARYDVVRAALAVELGVTYQAVSAAVRADLTGRPYSQDLMRRILDAANAILLRREEAVST